ncbi:MAG: hypothetical protein ACLFV2_02210 [Desulfurivibrionaceae bacterium]
MRLLIFNLLVICFLLPVNVSAQGVSNYKQWESHPDVPRISAEEVSDIVKRGEKVIFIYAGYKIEDTICNSIYIPYTLVPTFGSGAKVSPRFPKDWWVLAYCP